MFEELIRQIEAIGKSHRISIQVPLDDKGYYDRKCPNPACSAHFKVLFEDWRDKVSDAQVFCPFCKHEAQATEWNTPEQCEHIKSVAQAEAAKLLQGAMERGVRRSRPQRLGGGLLSLSMSLSFKAGAIPPVFVAQASEALRQEFACDHCGCRYASLGASFFCPACGHNSAASCFDTTLETVEKVIRSLEPMRKTLAESVDPDTAHNAIRQLLEDQFARLVGAFERMNEFLFDRLPNASSYPRKGAVFQRIDDASQLWQQAAGKGYDVFLSPNEFQRLKLLFQRRHVLSHRQGIVDQTYVDRSGDRTYNVGQRLVTGEGDVLELVGLLRKLITCLRT